MGTRLLCNLDLLIRLEIQLQVCKNTGTFDKEAAGLFIFNCSHWIYFLLDVPMSSGVSNIRSKGNLLNCYEFEWDPNKGSEVYIIVSKNFDPIFLLYR